METIKENKMASTPMLKLIISMSLPSMFSMLIQSLYNIVDSMYVAYSSQAALTAVSLAFPVQMLLVAVSVGTGIGINSLVSRRLGEKRFAEANSAATHGVLLAIASWVLFVILGALFIEPYFSMLDASAEVKEMAITYTSIVVFVSIGSFLEVNLEKTLQATGNMIYPMLFQLVGAVTNIILDPIFIFGFLGVPAMGIAGAAIATVAGQIVAMVFAVIIVFTKSHDVHITFKNFRINWTTIKDIYIVGVPSIVMQAIGSVLTTALNWILIGFSEAAVSVFGIYYKLQSFVFMPVFGLTHGVMPIMGYSYGARNKKRLLSALKYGCIIAVIIMAVGMLIFMTIPELLLMIFNATDEILAIGVPALRTISLCFIAAAIGIMFSTLFQALGLGFNSLLVSLLRQIIILLPAAYLLSKISLDAVWYAFVIAECFSLVASILIYWGVYRKRIRNLQ
ncbi:MAG TPA: MATE family efflux transporter [Candidatus Aphodoplasma excrementigallinarum]|uniref:Probable multidrug resistance protein NorM n=1 Tax=Candidatus Aphodoplasma excrementigallinarum TaxID=2840673 RepID=A0A9D1SYX7_9FIRM|nr:MATE family efflux transporter [Candidatus Aphodoplasma excrementigallinarum]